MAIDDEPAAPTTPEAPNDPSAPRARKRHVTRGILILMILTVAGVVAPFIANIFASHSGAGLDSTKVFQVGIHNDTAHVIAGFAAISSHSAGPMAPS